MTTTRALAVFARISTFATVALLATAMRTTVSAQEMCNPPCGPGQSCVQGICMIPAPAAGPAPTTIYAPPPAAGQPTTTYPPAGSAPPPGYYAPPPTSPPPPGYAPPPGYSQPGAYPQQPGAYPQPGGPPPPYSYGPPPEARPVRRRGFLALPYLGLNSYQGVNGESFGPGFRLGGLFGGRLNEMVSLNGELTVDFINVENPPVDTDVTAVDFVLAFSPLWHFPAGNVEFVVGPKLGLRRYVESDDAGTGDTTTYTLTGYVFGVNAGWFGAISNGMSIGGLLNFDFRSLHESCQKSSGFAQSCSTSGNGPSDKVLGIVAALLF